MQQRKTVFITGASRGIGHATAQYFVRQGWRAITCSREVVPPQCPRNERHAHITADLSETSRLSEAMAQLEHILNGAELHALVNNAGYSPKSEDGSRLGCLDGDMGVWQKTFAINFMAPVYFARTGTDAGEDRRCRGQHHVDRRSPGPSLRRLRLFDFEGGADGIDPRAGGRPREHGHPRQRRLSG